MNGLIVIDKPVGPTSHDIVACVRRKLGIKRVGHAGTLDPDASGLLVVCVGTSTRLLEYMTSEEKTYTGELVIGIGTDTDDASGEIIERKSVHIGMEFDFHGVIQEFTGDILQTVPKYSAVHIDGKRAYQLARSGLDFKPPAKMVHIQEIHLENVRYDSQLAQIDFVVSCSKGTYIRSLCRDIGSYLGFPAHMGSLRRIQAGPFSIADAVPLSDFQSATHPSDFLQNPLTGLHHLPSLTFNDDQISRLVQGQSIPVDKLISQGIYVVVVEGEVGMIVECGERNGTWAVKPKKVLLERR